jgi:hypothetical protein
MGAVASLGEFVGGWRNSDPDTRGITRLDIRVTGSKVTVQAWGKCHPEDCDWGRVSATAYGPNVSANLQTSAQSVLATFQTRFSQTLLILDAARGRRLRTQVLTRFTDNSGRNNYSRSYSFVRSSKSAGTMKQVSPSVKGAAAKASALLPAPVQRGPSNGMSFNRYPRTTTLTWRPVSGAVSYGIEIDCMGCCQTGRWCADVGKRWKIQTGLTSARYVFDFVGAQPGRWRVWAIGQNGRGGKRSGWWEFRYTK